jgi:peptidoglycan/LPS O-acetylase OafA/YrhL
LAVIGRRPESTGEVTKLLGAIAPFALLVFVGVCAMHTSSQTESALMIIVATIASVVLVARFVVAPSEGLASFFSLPAATWIGKRSYGIYLYHLPIAIVFLERCHLHGPSRAVVLCACLVLTVALAGASYRWVETPFLRRKARLGETQTATSGAAPPTTPSDSRTLTRSGSAR